jgi:signal transduction histidine kinase
MTSDPKSAAPSTRPPLIAWLVRVNGEVSQWAASMSWWRLILLFFILLIAGNIVEEMLHLQHDRVRVKKIRGGESVVVSIGGKDGIRITHAAKGTDATPPSAAASGAKPADPDADTDSDKDEEAAQKPFPSASGTIVVKDLDVDDLESALAGRKIVTFRGILGDVGGALMVMLFAYLVGAKIVTRKVAQADAKVRTAMNAAERETVERQLVQARLQVLQAQVEPHFLFNTLAAVDYLIETDPPRATQMQKALITYLRGALPQMRQGTSTLGREMRLVKSYLELIKMRIEDRLEVSLEVPESLETAEFPPMMLQTLVENAIKHGIEPKPDGGKVSVSARVQQGQLWVEVKDTGVGLPPGDLLEGPTSGTGIGLRNIRERLAMLYPGKSRLTLGSDDTGTTVRISVPFQVEAPAAAGDAPYAAGTA